MSLITLLVADDHMMFRECLVGRLSAEDDLKVLAHTGDASDLPTLVRDLSPHVVLLDSHMPGSPFLAAQDITRRFPVVRLVFLGSSCADSLIARAMDARASGFVLKDQGVEELLGALHVVAAGGTYFVPQALSRIVDVDTPAGNPTVKGLPTRLSQLSRREIEVLSLLAEGQSIKQAARSLGVSCKTVDNQTSNVMRKLDIHSRAELVRYAIREQVTTV